MSVGFHFTLSDEDAQEFIDIIIDNENSMMEKHLHCDDTAQRAWLKSRAEYVRRLREQVLSGNKRASEPTP